MSIAITAMLGVTSKVGLADLIKRKARSYSIASMYLADLWMVIATKVRKTMSGWILSLLKNIKWEIAYPLGGEIYRYLKTKNGKQISFGIREPYDIKKIESYELPSDDDMLMQAVDQMICEVCMFNEHCYMGMCIANEEWREGMRKTLDRKSVV